MKAGTAPIKYAALATPNNSSRMEETLPSISSWVAVVATAAIATKMKPAIGGASNAMNSALVNASRIRVAGPIGSLARRASKNLAYFSSHIVISVSCKFRMLGRTQSAQARMFATCSERKGPSRPESAVQHCVATQCQDGKCCSRTGSANSRQLTQKAKRMTIVNVGVDLAKTSLPCTASVKPASPSWSARALPAAG